MARVNILLSEISYYKDLTRKKNKTQILEKLSTIFHMHPSTTHRECRLWASSVVKLLSDYASKGPYTCRSNSHDIVDIDQKMSATMVSKDRHLGEDNTERC
jgi:hypothetical protein